VTDLDRLKAVLEEVVTAVVERVVVQGDLLVYFAEWIYVVDSVGSGTASLRSTDPRLPDLADIPLWQGTGGALAVPALGSQVRVRFLNADRTKPIISGLDTNAPQSVAIDGGGPAVGRVNDPVKVTFTVADFTPLAAGLLCAGSGSPPTVSGTAQPFDITGVITGGSAKVTSG
jgi:hypothetical protein